MRTLWHGTVGLILTRMNYYFLIFPFCRSGTKAKSRRWVLPLNTQCLPKIWREVGYTRFAGCLGLPCYYVWDTVWKQIIIQIYIISCLHQKIFENIKYLIPSNGIRTYKLLCLQSHSWKKKFSFSSIIKYEW